MKIIGEKNLGASIVVLSIHKSGSTLLSKIIKGICLESGIAHASPADYFFSNGISPDDWENDPDNVQYMLDKPGTVWHGFRRYGHMAQEYIKRQVANAEPLKVIILIRDPRDVLVSLYYSNKSSHKLPGEGSEREQFLKRRENIIHTELDDFCEKQLLAYKNHVGVTYNLECLLDAYDALQNAGVPVTLYKYEDVIFSKYYWVKSLCDDMMLPDDLKLSDESAFALASLHDVLPKVEDVKSHIRSVSPGDHARKLNTKTIANLNLELGSLLSRCSYTY